MESKFNLFFWKKDYIERFKLDREAQEILNSFISLSPQKAEQFIKDKYARSVSREDIIDTYCISNDVKKINSILKEIDENELSIEEIKEYKILELNEKENFDGFNRGKTIQKNIKMAQNRFSCEIN